MKLSVPVTVERLLSTRSWFSLVADPKVPSHTNQPGTWYINTYTKYDVVAFITPSSST